MNRRAFLRSVLVGTAAVVAAPYLPYLPTLAPVSFGNRFIQTGVYIPQRKLCARIRLTEEIVRDTTPGAFSAAMRAETASLLRDIMHREERWLR